MAKQPTQVTDNGAQVVETATKGDVIPHVNPKALQREVGIEVVKLFARAEQAKSDLEELRNEINSKNYEAIGKLTQGVLFVAKNDSNVNLADHFAQDDKRKRMLNETLYLALGMKEVIKVGTGTAQTDKVVWSRALKDYLPQYGEPQDTKDYERKNTFRTNLAKQLNKAAGAALDMQKRKINAKFDPSQGTLVIEGPEVKKQFGVESVALNEKLAQGVEGSDGKKSNLKEKPSFTALYNNAAKAEGLPVKSKTNDRTSKVIADPSAAIVEMSTLWLNVLGRATTETLTKPAIEALEKIRDRIDALID